MTTYLGKSCSFGLPRVPFVNCRSGFEGRMWDLIVSVPDHCLSFYFGSAQVPNTVVYLVSMISFRSAVEDI